MLDATFLSGDDGKVCSMKINACSHLSWHDFAEPTVRHDDRCAEPEACEFIELCDGVVCEPEFAEDLDDDEQRCIQVSMMRPWSRKL